MEQQIGLPKSPAHGARMRATFSPKCHTETSSVETATEDSSAFRCGEAAKNPDGNEAFETAKRSLNGACMPLSISSDVNLLAFAALVSRAVAWRAPIRPVAIC